MFYLVIFKEEIFSEIVPCYRIKKKNSKEKNVDYVGRVENCLKKTNAEEKYFNYKQFARNMDKIKVIIFNIRKIMTI